MPAQGVADLLSCPLVLSNAGLNGTIYLNPCGTTTLACGANATACVVKVRAYSPRALRSFPRCLRCSAASPIRRARCYTGNSPRARSVPAAVSRTLGIALYRFAKKPPLCRSATYTGGNSTGCPVGVQRSIVVNYICSNFTTYMDYSAPVAPGSCTYHVNFRTCVFASTLANCLVHFRLGVCRPVACPTNLPACSSLDQLVRSCLLFTLLERRCVARRAVIRAQTARPASSASCRRDAFHFVRERALSFISSASLFPADGCSASMCRFTAQGVNSTFNYDLSDLGLERDWVFELQGYCTPTLTCPI